MANGQLPLYIGAYCRSQIDNTANTSLDGLSSVLSQVTHLVGNSKVTVILTGEFNCPDNAGTTWVPRQEAKSLVLVRS